jgi:molybdenum cofactor synthesis domain-containing protein
VSGLRARVITVSTRASAGVWQDTSGPVIVDGLTALGFSCEGPIVVPDGDHVARVLREAVDDDLHLVVTTGGTGHTPADLTPEQTRTVIERESPGLAEAVRSYGVVHGVPTAILSRGIAGIAGRTLIVNLPGSTGGARDGVAALAPVLVHAVDQIRGGDHVRTPEGSPD